MGDVSLGDVSLGDVSLGDVSLGDVSLGDVSILCNRGNPPGECLTNLGVIEKFVSKFKTLRMSALLTSTSLHAVKHKHVHTCTHVHADTHTHTHTCMHTLTEIQRNIEDNELHKLVRQGPWEKKRAKESRCTKDLHL